MTDINVKWSAYFSTKIDGTENKDAAKISSYMTTHGDPNYDASRAKPAAHKCLHFKTTKTNTPSLHHHNYIVYSSVVFSES
jgi:hypothetical protein